MISCLMGLEAMAIGAQSLQIPNVIVVMIAINVVEI